MSGHSKWHQIKHKKSVTDSKRGEQFTRLAKQISAATRSNPNPDQNPSLREAIAKAQQANMPQDNIDNLLQKTSSTTLQSATYEAFGPGGAALLIIVDTNNTKRTVAEIRHLLNQHEATLSEPHSVLWKFKQTALGQFAPQFIQPSNPAYQQPLTNLIKNLQDHPDVRSVFTDVTI